MEQMIEKAGVLIEAMPYIQRFHREIVVVKFGGSIMDDTDAVAAILTDVAFMATAGLWPVIVHGGGKAISRAMAAAGIEPVFRKGLRFTDERTIAVVEHVLNHEVNPAMVATLQRTGTKARGLHGDDLLHVVPHREKDPDTGALLEWGYVGEPREVDTEPILAFLSSEIVPVITPLGRGEDHQRYNVNADKAASAIARALRARKLVFLSDVPGLLSDPADTASVISSVKVGDVEELIRRGTITGGMLPKIGGALKAVHEGVSKVHIIDASLPHSLLLELFTEKGVGTEIVR